VGKDKEMIKISPTIDFNAKCPSDGADLDITGVAIPGMRCLIDSICPCCGTAYYLDLPVAHALWSPVILNQKTAEIYESRKFYWFNKLLKEGFLNQVDLEIVPIVHKFFEANRIIIVNCLDFLYGHSLLKLLNVQRHLDNDPELGCCVLVPSQLVHLVPDGVAEIWEFPVAIKEGGKWYCSLQSWMNEQLTQYEECYLSKAYPHPSHRVYDLPRFVRNLPDISPEIRGGKPIILYSYREDRLWGRTLTHQQRNLQKLYTRLSAIFPDLVFVLIGFGNNNKISATRAKLIDLRTDRFNVDCDRLWMAYMCVSDCVIGVHGSNMLLPSGLAKSTVELVPQSRLGNIFQDILFSRHFQDIREGFLNYRFIYGNDNLSDVRTSIVADLIMGIIAYNERHSFWFKVSESESNEFNYSNPEFSQLVAQYFSIRYNPNSYNLKTKLKSKITKFHLDRLHKLDTEE